VVLDRHLVDFPGVSVFSTRSPILAFEPCGQMLRKMPPPSLVISRSAATGENWKLGRTGGAPAGGVGRRNVNPRKPEPKNRWPGKDTSSSNEFFPAIQITPAARGLELPVVMASARTMFRPSFGATMIPTGAPSPPNAGEPSISEIWVVAGLRARNTVSGLSISGRLTRYVPLGKNSTACLSMAASKASVSSVWPSPRTPNERTFTHWSMAGVAGMSVASGCAGWATARALWLVAMPFSRPSSPIISPCEKRSTT
jgi:hypothetical protein